MSEEAIYRGDYRNQKIFEIALVKNIENKYMNDWVIYYVHKNVHNEVWCVSHTKISTPQIKLVIISN